MQSGLVRGNSQHVIRRREGEREDEGLVDSTSEFGHFRAITGREYPDQRSLQNDPVNSPKLMLKVTHHWGHTISLAVANASPSGLNAIARRGELCAGMMLTFPVSNSTICTCPGERPGKASSFCPKQASPMGLSVVSKTEIFWGGFEKAKI